MGAIEKYSEMGIDLRLVESFVLVARCGTLSQAEEDSGISKATLSRQMTRLEDLLGQQLFIRTSRKATLTEAGRLLYERCSRLMRTMQTDLETVLIDVQNLSRGISGELHLMTTNYFSTTFVAPAVERYMSLYPKVRCHLRIVEDKPNPLFPDEADCFVCTTPPDHPNLIAKRIGSFHCRLYASPAYLKQHGAPQHPTDLSANLSAHRTNVRRDELSDGKWRFYRERECAEVAPACTVVSNDYWVDKTFCIDGYGISYLPDFFTRVEVDAGVLVPVLPEWASATLPVYCVYQKQRHASEKLKAFINLMADNFSSTETFMMYVVLGRKNQAVGIAAKAVPATVSVSRKTQA
ncbi:LysR family transcriptional regulator [Herbaspirillum sp. RV1423]|uniref:LysR family transcriptional regulator n=1 Tax=Herbaspirillum sp. RV1423 TaxID=1443993 RepID=UPI0004AFBD46|nr:LysR family transcriptional regulator [Herbaspirillum sp. RV1423]